MTTLADTALQDLPPPGSPRRVHPTVRLDYGLRVLGQGFFGAVALSVLQLRAMPVGVLVLICGTALLWPHLAYLLALFNVLVQWDGLKPDKEGRIHLSIAAFSL